MGSLGRDKVKWMEVRTKKLNLQRKCVEESVLLILIIVGVPTDMFEEWQLSNYLL